MGQSNGGSVAINVAKGDTRSNRPASARKAIVPWLPTTRGAAHSGGRKVELESPLMIFAGSDDDWTPASECEGVKSTKANLEVKTYPGAAHSFDLNIIPQRYLGKMLGHHKEAAEDSRQRMVNFFVEHTVGGLEEGSPQQGRWRTGSQYAALIRRGPWRTITSATKGPKAANKAPHRAMRRLVCMPLAALRALLGQGHGSWRSLIAINKVCRATRNMQMKLPCPEYGLSGPDIDQLRAVYSSAKADGEARFYERLLRN